MAERHGRRKLFTSFRKQKEKKKEKVQGQIIPFKGTLPVTHFLESSSPPNSPFNKNL
jgi:hypothetical protein